MIKCENACPRGKFDGCCHKGDPAYKAVPVLQGPVHTYRNRQDQGEWKPGWSETGKAKTEAVSQGVQRGKTILL